jgi:ubiquinone/menaquinone biosynthesis C-methylase UbiE
LESYRGKRILDIGCGPRGSLEWADVAAKRVGLDPLAEQYLALGAGQHKMQYVAAYSESIPFPDGHFDVVCSFNSLDHVVDLGRTIREIKRVTKRGGLLLLLVEINHQPTELEPHCLGWDSVELFKPEFVLRTQQHYECGKNGMYDSILEGLLYDHSAPVSRSAYLSALFRRID